MTSETPFGWTWRRNKKTGNPFLIVDEEAPYHLTKQNTVISHKSGQEYVSVKEMQEMEEGKSASQLRQEANIRNAEAERQRQLLQRKKEADFLNYRDTEIDRARERRKITEETKKLLDKLSKTTDKKEVERLNQEILRLFEEGERLSPKRFPN